MEKTAMRKTQENPIQMVIGGRTRKITVKK
jgi:hypothetical protein